MNLHMSASSSWDRSISDCRQGSAFVQSDFEIVGSMAANLLALDLLKHP